MGWSLLTWLLVTAGAVVGLGILGVLWLAGVLAWGDQATEGLGYYGRSLEGRRRFRKALRIHARLLRPALWLMARTTTFTFDCASFPFRDITGPQGTCEPESFERAASYEPRPEDVFVVSQMRSGTTWMQNLVYEILQRGTRPLVEEGTALHAVSAWLEARKTVAPGEAPVVGEERPSRLMKSHFPAHLCPFGEDARYVYVARHPVSCFASCVDFIAANAGPLAPDVGTVESWFCSEEMWWGPWPDHVEGWWRRAREAENVLFLHFEAMKEDLAGVARRVAEFLDMEPLKGEEMEGILHRCSFDYMRGNLETFEMHPPHLLSVEAELFREGTRDRHRDVPEDVRRRVAAWCARRMEGGSYPLADRYPEVAGTEDGGGGRGGPTR